MKARGKEHWIPLGVLVLLNALIAGSELFHVAPPRNDALLHIHQVMRMDEAVRGGQALLDHWDPTIGLGYPFPRTYSCGTHIVLWASWRLTGLDVATLYGFLTFLGWAIWPLSTFFGLRLLGQSPREALAAAWLAPFLHTGFRFGIATESYFWLGYGLLPNLLGLVLFPLALGLGLRYVLEGKRLLGFVAILSLTFFTHLIMGYVTVISLCVCLLARWPEWRTQAAPVLTRLGGSGLAVLGSCLFFLWPYLADHDVINHSRFEAKAYWDSYPATEVLLAALKGQLLDFHMPLPVISLLALGGLGLALRNRRSALPAMLPFLYWFTVFLGRTKWNLAVWLMPMADNLPLERAIVPLQYFALALAGQALAFLLDRKSAQDKRFTLIWTLVPPLLLCFHLARNIEQNLIQAQRFKAQRMASRFEPELDDIRNLLMQSQDGGRLLVPADRAIKLGARGFFEIPLALDLPHVGNLWHSMSLNSDFLYEFHPERSDHWQLFGLKYGLAPPGYWKNEELQALTRSGSYELTRNAAYQGLFDFGQISEVLEGSPCDHYDRVKAWMMSDAPARGDYLGFHWDKSLPILPYDASSERTFSCRSKPLEERGAFGYQLTTRSKSNGYLIAKITWHPGWTALVDDQEVAIGMASPALMAIPLAAGEHRILLRYQPSAGRFWLKLLSLFVFSYCAWTSIKKAPVKSEQSAAATPVKQRKHANKPSPK